MVEMTLVEDDNRFQKTIKITKCLHANCSGSYTDSLFESILILCKDPKHKHHHMNPETEMIIMSDNKKREVGPSSPMQARPPQSRATRTTQPDSFS
jgi:hypothetical protein